MSQDLGSKARDFANFFYESVRDRIYQATGIKVDREPEISFGRVRDIYEEAEFRKARLDSDSESSGEEALQVLKKYEGTLENGIIGGFNPESKKIVLDEQIICDRADYISIGHEICHNIRDFLFPTERGLGYHDCFKKFNRLIRMGNINQEVIEFFGLLSPLIVQDVCMGNCEEAVKQSRNYRVYDLKSLKGDYEWFGRNPAGKMLEILKDFSRVGEAVAAVYKLSVPLTEDQLGIVNRLVDHVTCFLNKHIPLLLLEDFDFFSIQQLDEYCLSNTKKFLDGNPHSKDWREVYANMAIDFNKFVQISTTRNFFESLLPYYRATIAVNENRSKLERNWPKAFTLKGQKIQREYIDPVLRKIKLMRLREKIPWNQIKRRENIKELERLASESKGYLMNSNRAFMLKMITTIEEIEAKKEEESRENPINL